MRGNTCTCNFFYKKMAIVPLAAAYIEAKFDKGSNHHYGSMVIVPPLQNVIVLKPIVI